MKILHALPHRVCESTCYVNGLEDLLAWKGADYTDYLLSVVGGMAGFTYLRFKRADPPCMVYWGANPMYLMKDLAQIVGFEETLIEGRSFKFTFPRLKDFIDQRRPVVAGALDMYYLHYYPELYRKQHVPIHYVLVVGYDDEDRVVFVHDCSHRNVQKIPYDEFEKSLNVKVPGMSKRNTIRAFALPQSIPSEFEVAEKGFSYKAERFLNPPVRLFGIPAMRKLADEIFEWDNEKCFEHMVTYATTPPLLPETFENSHGMRFWQAEVLGKLGNKYNVSKWTQTSTLFRKSGRKITELCRAALDQDKQQVSNFLAEIADIEEQAYALLKER
ncbi:MAG: BtrH N-terminal domain-containing protein [Candidatus Bathyarchaeota archaeon]|nr:BtrH N-terminal domain-containing protein [Candidatus Bathyarchaeota archaeon]